MSTVHQLYLSVAGFMQREPAAFIRGTPPNTHNVLLQAMNNARLYAERRIDFELAKKSIEIQNVPLATGAQLSDAVEFGTTTPVVVKKLLKCYIVQADGVSTFPVRLVTKDNFVARRQRGLENFAPTDPVDTAYLNETPICAIRYGSRIMLAPASAEAIGGDTFHFAADVVAMLDSYDIDARPTQNDFLLTYCFDWLMYRSVEELNYFLKEDQRVSISANMVADAWQAIVAWNNELLLASADNVSNLD